MSFFSSCICVSDFNLQRALIFKRPNPNPKARPAPHPLFTLQGGDSLGSCSLSVSNGDREIELRLYLHLNMGHLPR